MEYTAVEISDSLIEFLKSKILAEEVDLQYDTELPDIGVDSLSIVEITLFIERKFGLVLPFEELNSETIGSVGALTECCQRLMRNNAGNV